MYLQKDDTVFLLVFSQLLDAVENNKYYIDIANDFGIRCEKLGESVISNKNALSYKYLDSNKLDKKKLAKAKENDNNIK